MIPGIPSAKWTRGPEYTRGSSRQLWYFSTLTHSLPTLRLARKLRYEWNCSLFFLHCVPLVSCLQGVAPLFIHKGEAVLWLFMARSPCTTAFYMEAWNRHVKERMSGANNGPTAPRGLPPLDHRLWPPPSRGRPWAGPTLLLGGVLLLLSWIDRRLCHSFMRFSVQSAFRWISRAFYVCDLQKHACTKTCGKCELKSLILSLVFIWAYFIWKLAFRSWS
jgi:hypothetical protein